jgi:hypothetical protein
MTLNNVPLISQSAMYVVEAQNLEIQGQSGTGKVCISYSDMGTDGYRLFGLAGMQKRVFVLDKFILYGRRTFLGVMGDFEKVYRGE